MTPKNTGVSGSTPSSSHTHLATREGWNTKHDDAIHIDDCVGRCAMMGRRDVGMSSVVVAVARERVDEGGQSRCEGGSKRRGKAAQSRSSSYFTAGGAFTRHRV